LDDAPADGDIIDLFETNEIFVVKEVFAGTVASPEQAGSVAVPGVQGKTSAFTKTSTGVTTMLEAADVDRTVIVHVHITEDYETGTGTLPTLKIGETSTDNKFMAVTNLVDESNIPTSPNQAIDRVFSGTLSATKDFIVTATAAVGDSTGGATVTVIAVPKA
jgi:hypothetical protein